MSDNRWFMLGVIFLTRIGMGYQFQSIGSVGPLLVDSLMIDFAALGVLIGLYKLPGMVLAYPSGLLGRRFGDRDMAALGVALMAMGGLLTSFVDTYGIIVAGRALSGAGAVLFNVLSAKLVLDWFADRGTTLAMSIHISSWPLGLALGLSSQAGLAETFSVSTMLLFTAAVCGAGLVLMVTFTRDQRAAAPPRLAAWHQMLSADTFRRTTLAAMVWCVFNVAIVLVLGFGPAYLVSRGYSVRQAGWTSSLFTWASIVSVPLGGYLVQRFGRADLLMGFSFLAGATAILAVTRMDDPSIAFVLIGLFGVMGAGSVVALPAGVLAAHERSVGMGLFFSYYYLGMGIFPPIAGWLRDVTGAPAAPLWFAALLMLSSWLFLLLFRRDQRRAEAGLESVSP